MNNIDQSQADAAVAKEKSDEIHTDANSKGTTTSDGGNKSEEEPPPSSSDVSLAKFLSLAKPETLMLVVALLLMIAAEALGLYNPLLIAQAYDDLVDVTLSPGQRMAQINRVMLLALVIHFSSVLLGFFRHAIMGVAGERVVARTRNGLYRSILRQEIGFFDVHKTGELVSRLGSDAALLQQGTSQALPEVLIGIIKVLVSVSIMFWISPKLAAVMIGFVLMIMVRNT
jgi:ATP-binding cassette, subfamily B, bacterial